MPHCLSARGSCRGWSPASAVPLAAPPWAARPSTSSTLGRFRCGACPITRFRAAPATPALPATAVMKLALLLRTVARPSLVFSRTTCPPAALMVALAALAEARLVYSTTYSVLPVACWAAVLLAGDWLLAPALNGTASVSPTIATSAPIRSFRMASSSSSPEHSAAPGTPEELTREKHAGLGDLQPFPPFVRARQPAEDHPGVSAW